MNQFDAGRPVQFDTAKVLATRTRDTAAIETFYGIEEALTWLGIS